MKFKISFFAIMFYLSMLISSHRALTVIFVCATIHEIGHLLAAKLRKVRVTELNVNLMGARITLDGMYSYRDELIIAFSGPLANILCAMLSYPIILILGVQNELVLFFYSSVSLAITNLLPIKDLDGGRILGAIILKRSSIRVCDAILSVTSFIILFMIWSISVYLLIKNTSSLSIFIFSISLFNDLFISKNRLSRI